MSGGFFIIGRVTEKDFGETILVRCPNCHNETALHLVYRKTWLEYFWIKIYAYRKKYLLVCPVCSRARELEKGEIELAKRLNQATTAYLNKTMEQDEYRRIVAAARAELSLPP